MVRGSSFGDCELPLEVATCHLGMHLFYGFGKAMERLCIIIIILEQVWPRCLTFYGVT